MADAMPSGCGRVRGGRTGRAMASVSLSCLAGTAPCRALGFGMRAQTSRMRIRPSPSDASIPVSRSLRPQRFRSLPLHSMVEDETDQMPCSADIPPEYFKDEEGSMHVILLPPDDSSATLPHQPNQEPQLQLSDADAQANPLRSWARNTLFMGIDPSPDIIAIATIYFIEGALGLAQLAKTFLLKEELHLGPAEMSALTGIFVLPWTIKPLYGFLSDGVPLFGYKRRSYLMVAGIVGCLSYTALGQNFWGVFDSTTAPADGEVGPLMIQATVASLLISSACIAFSDVVADGIVVQKTREHSQDDPALAGGLQSLCWASAALGGILSAYFSGSLLEVMKPQEVFQLTAILPFVVACIAFLIDEQPVVSIGAAAMSNRDGSVNGSIAADGAHCVNGDMAEEPSSSSLDLAIIQSDDIQYESSSIKGQIDALWEAFQKPSIWKPTLFLFLWQSTPTSDGAFLYFMTDELGFGPEFLGRVRVVTAAASLLGVWVYNTYLKRVAIKDVLFWSSIVSFPLGMSSLLLVTHANRALGIPDAAFVFGDDVALAVLGEIAFMPVLVLAARLCPPGIEAVLFATLMSINNGAGTVGTEIGAALTKWLGVTGQNFDNLALLLIICNVSSLYPLFFIGWLDEVGFSEEEEATRSNALKESDNSVAATEETRQ